MITLFAKSARGRMNTTWNIAELGADGGASALYGHGAGIQQNGA